MKQFFILTVFIIMMMITSFFQCDRLDNLMSKHWHYCGQSLHQRNRIIMPNKTTTTATDDNQFSTKPQNQTTFEARFDFILKSQHECSYDDDDDIDDGNELSARIVGGQNAERNEFPWQISLRRYNKILNKWYHSCGGVVIDSHWILTAAHCVLGSNDPNHYRVRLGEYDYSMDEGYEFDYNVSHIFAHNDFNFQTVEPDICLLKLSKEIDFGTDSNIRPICFTQLPLPATNSTKIVESFVEKKPSTCISTGWGKTVFREFEQDGEFPKILQKVCVNIVDHQDCRRRYSEVINVTDTMICLGEGGSGTCEGDSGGPFQCIDNLMMKNAIEAQPRWSLYGLTSWAIGCAEDQFPSVATNILALREWIYEQIFKSDSLSL